MASYHHRLNSESQRRRYLQCYKYIHNEWQSEYVVIYQQDFERSVGAHTLDDQDVDDRR